MNMHVLKRFQHHFPSRPVLFYMYTLSQFPLWSIQSKCCRLYGTMIHIESQIMKVQKVQPNASFLPPERLKPTTSGLPD